MKTLKDLSLFGVLQDRDALYNTMFYSPAFYATTNGDWQGYYGGSGRFGSLWPGPSTAVAFENGTIRTFKTTARVRGDFSGIHDGTSFYNKYCNGTVPVTAVATPTAPSPTPTPTAGNLTAPPPLGYPTPVVIASDQSAAGYFLPNSDVAVLALLTYEPDIPAEFQLAVQTLIAEAKGEYSHLLSCDAVSISPLEKLLDLIFFRMANQENDNDAAAGKTKLIVDVSANGGGLIFQGHDTFRQLFPQIQQDGFNRWRSNEVLQIAARQYSAAIPTGFDPETSPNETLIGIYEDYNDYRFDLDQANKSFANVEAKFDTDTFNGDNFTQIHRWNFDDPLSTMYACLSVPCYVVG